MIPVVGAFLISVVGVQISAMAARKLGVVDRVKVDRWHQTGPIPKMAGPAILIALAPWIGLEHLFILSCFCLIGVIDDIHTMNPLVKGVILLIPSGLAGWVDQSVWVGVVCWILANSFNLLDHADGIAATTAIVISVGAGNPLGFTGAAACAGFLPHNFPTARVFLGDGGSLMIGALIALCWAENGVLATTVAAAVPLGDTLFVTLRRIWRGQKPWVGNTDHTGHVLLRMGVPPKIVPAIYALITGLCLFMAHQASR